MQKIKMHIVVGEVFQPRLISAIQRFNPQFDITCIVNENTYGYLSHLPSIRFIVAQTEENGAYFKDLKRHLDGSDLVVSFGCFNIAAFQCHQICMEENISMGFLAVDFDLKKYVHTKNLWKIGSEIIKTADFIFFHTKDALHEFSRQASEFGIEEIQAKQNESLYCIGIDSCKSHFQYSESGRTRFRQGLGMKDSDILISSVSFNGDQGIEFIRFAGCLSQFSPELFSRMKFLLICDRMGSRDLKLRSVDEKLGQHMMFLHQDPKDFEVDLWSASDFVFASSRAGDRDNIPLFMLESLVCRAIPIVDEFYLKQFPYIADRVLINAHNQFEKKFTNAIDAIAIVDTYREHRFNLDNFVESSNSIDLVVSSVFDSVMNIKNHSFKHTNRFIIEQRIKKLQSTVDAGQMTGIDEDEILRFMHDYQLKANEKSRIYSLLGRKRFYFGDYDKATEYYDLALQADKKNVAAYSGLGYLALQSELFEESILYFRKSLGIEQWDPKALIGMGMNYRRLGLYEESIQWFKKCLNIESSIESAVRAICQTVRDHCSLGFAIDVLQDTIEEIGENQTVMVCLGSLLIENGDSEAGSRILSRVS